MHSDMPRTLGTHKNTWTDGFGCQHTMLAEYHHRQHLISKQMDVDPFQKKEREERCIVISLIVFDIFNVKKVTFGTPCHLIVLYQKRSQGLDASEREIPTIKNAFFIPRLLSRKKIFHKHNCFSVFLLYQRLCTITVSGKKFWEWKLHRIFPRIVKYAETLHFLKIFKKEKKTIL